jgi:transcription antitermination factor NusG
MNGNKKWHVLNARREWKKKLLAILSRRKIENYCPTHKVMIQSVNRIKFVDEPLFGSYIFVRISENEFEDLKQTGGAINFFYCLDKPAVISNSEIEAIKQFLKEYTGVKLERASVNINDRLRMPGHLFMEHQDNITGSKEKVCKVIIPSLGYMMTAKLETLDETSHSYKISHESMANG